MGGEEGGEAVGHIQADFLAEVEMDGLAVIFHLIQCDYVFVHSNCKCFSMHQRECSLWDFAFFVCLVAAELLSPVLAPSTPTR